MRILDLNTSEDAKNEITKIGADKNSFKYMLTKFLFYTIKLKNIRSAAANIIKQEVLALGGEAAVSKGAINLSTKNTDVLIGGTEKQLLLLIKKLKHHQFGLAKISDETQKILKKYTSNPKDIKIGNKKFIFGKKTYIMGILNTTPDSFFDGGKYFNIDEAVVRGIQIEKEGADIVDIGGESTRPGSGTVSVKKEMDRVIPVIRKLVKKIRIPISIDTRKSKVALEAIKAGAKLVNDTSGLRHDKKMAQVIAKSNVPVVIMHIKGTPKNMQKNPSYDDAIDEIINYLKESIEIAENAGILQNKIIVDPGIGFGKRVEDNLEILRRIREFKVLGKAILIGTSRKSFIGDVLGLPVENRLLGTVATCVSSILNGVDILRVHDVKEIRQIAKITDAIARL
jgi:dihydropteroate synthase